MEILYFHDCLGLKKWHQRRSALNLDSIYWPQEPEEVDEGEAGQAISA